MPEPVALLHLVDCLNPGGTERQLIEQCRRIDRARFRPLVGVFHEGGTLAPELQALDVPVYPWPLHTRLAHPNTAVQILHMIARARRERVRIIHAHDFYGDLLGVPIARLTGARLVASRRDLMHWLSPAKRAALAAACRVADRLVTNAETIARAAVETQGVPASRVRVVPNGIDLARFDAEARRAPDPPLPPALARRGAPIVAVVSNMNLPDKGHRDLLSAAARLAMRGHPIRLALIGDGPERPALQATALRLGLARTTFFLGRRLDVPRLLLRADLACLPSWAEGFPNALVEAMAAARPVVATAVGGCPELIDDAVTGLLVPPRDPARLAEALERLLTHPTQARRLGRTARRAIEARYSIDRSAALLQALYEELL
jgi:L-malate glycosyltransferase